VTTNAASKLRPTSQCHPDDYKVAIIEEGDSKEGKGLSVSKKVEGRNAIKEQLREFAAASKILFESVRAREGFFVCELTNHSDKPAKAGFTAAQAWSAPPLRSLPHSFDYRIYR
jgi:hypothetical protein